VGDAARAIGIVPEGTELHPPFTAVLTDLSPATGGTDPQGQVGLDGIHGHRIEHTIDLQLELHDATGQVPAYPVLVQLNLAGPNHGKLLLNDGALRCDSVARLWHERDAEGALLPDPTLRYELGRWAWYVGVLPDVASPGGVAPVWGSAEQLHLRAQAKLPDNQESDPFMHVYGVHPEPGRPDHLQCLMPDDQPCGDTFRVWPGYSVGKLVADEYFAADLYGNTVFGLTDTAETQPGNGVTVDFLAQLVHEDLGGDFAAYTLDLEWGPDASLLSGTVPVTLSVSVPASLPDWSAGTISKTITLDLQGGPDHLLIPKQDYDARFDADDGEMPMTVSPRAETAGMQSQALGDTPRLVLLAVAGTHVPYAIPFGGDEPSLEPQKVYRQQVGGWHKVEVPPTSQDLTLDTAAGGAVRLSLVDAHLNVVPQTAFRVHRCPRGEHLTEETPAPPACTLGPVDSDGMTGILPRLALNEPGGARGYLGIELTKAPVAPGTYYLWVESIGTTPYRVRIASNFATRDSQESEYRGGYAICTVAGVEILDESFGRLDDFELVGPTLAYVRAVGVSEGPETVVVDIETRGADNALIDKAPGVVLTRVASSSTCVSEPLELHPGWTETSPGLGKAAAGRRKARVARAGKVYVYGFRPQGYRFLAYKPAKWGDTYLVPLGLRLPLAMYKSRSFFDQSERWYICSWGGSDCGTELAYPSSITWSVSPASVTQEGDGQVARIEKDINGEFVEWRLRAIRMTTKPDGTERVPGGVVSLTGTVGGFYGGSDSVGIEVRRPSALGTGVDLGGNPIPGYPTFTVTYDGSSVCLRDLIVEVSDQYGIPPEYLTAQMYVESGFNPYCFRYEPTSVDFKKLTGDRSEDGSVMVEEGERRLTRTDRVYHLLGIGVGGQAEYLPCESLDLAPCIPLEVPPPVESNVTLLAPTAGDHWRIPGLGGDMIQLAVVLHPGEGPPTYSQSVLVECASAVLAVGEFCVDGDSGYLRFGVSPPGPVTIDFRRVRKLRQTPASTFGGLLPDVQATTDLIRTKNLPAYSWANLPPAIPSSTIRTWARARTSNPFKYNSLRRYDRSFGSGDLLKLLKLDPSFEIQGQWFAAASYGLEQIIPEDHRDKLQRNFPPADSDYLKTTFWDPMFESPTKLFNPRVVVPLGAATDVRVPVASEDLDTSCQGVFNNCTWERLWRRRFCKFNTGSQSDGQCPYAEKIMYGTPGSPGAESFVPQP